MTIFQAILLGIIQGITEFLPVSSSAHLVLIPYLLHWQIPQEQIFPFKIFIQLGTLVSLIVYFRKDLREITKAFIEGVISRKPFHEIKSRLGWLILLATIPAGLVGLMFIEKVEIIFGSPVIIAFFLFGTAFLLIIAEVVDKFLHELSDITWREALIIGIFQSISIFPGISRAGVCISGGMLQNYKRKEALRFSFLMAIPIMFITGFLSIIDLLKIQSWGQALPIILVGLLTAAVSGYFVLHWLLVYLNNHSLIPFAIYCVLLGLLVMAFSLSGLQLTSKTSKANQSQLLQVFYSPSLSWIDPLVINCNSNDFTLNLRFSALTEIKEISENSLYLTFQPIEKSDNLTYLLGNETLQIVTNSANPLNQLTKKQVNNLYQGLFITWGDFFNTCNRCSQNGISSSIAGQEIHLWVFPPTSTEQITFIKKVLDAKQLSSFASIAADPMDMLEALRTNPAAIGILPSYWLDKTIKPINITDAAKNEFQLPILAIVPKWLLETVKSLLVCLQVSIKS